ncbi:hybrid sensor histidine kinase/response regulator [Hymenobacter edaphi]|uniref:Sensory/regulatory protein RpfC n=1 Tax=Hymenobacter edaphi TaxID=2211146 RepID=A0A328BLX2_9BACT|nr:hybrid sensor histidine kinase/response regulator [Hymenobacter edaphi]RAK66976.1 hypothetical protein DLM85_12290 [Hymenobacter edaphi]
MIRFCARFGLLLCLLWAGLAPAPAQQRHWLKQFGPAEGFAPSFVYALHQDRQGYLWVATAEGLVRYDGTEFVTFTTRQGLAEDFATRLYEDSTTRTLWVNHYQGGVSRWDGQRFQRADKTTPLPAGFKARTGLPVADTAAISSYRHYFHLPEVPDISCLLQDREGNAWLGTAGQGLWRHSDRHLFLRPSRQLPHQPLTAMSRQDAWLLGGADGAVFSLFSPASLPPARPFSMLGPALPARVTALAYPPAAVAHERPAAAWAGTATQGVWRVGAGRRQRLPRLPANLRVTSLAWQPADSSLWVGTEADGLYHWFSQPARPTQHYTTATGLLHNAITALLCDPQGRVWIGTHDTGLAVWQAGRFTYHRFRNGIDVADFAFSTRGDTVWVGTTGQGLLRYAGGHFRQFTTADGLGSNYCYAVVPFRRSTEAHDMYAGYGLYQDYLLLVHQNQLTAFDPHRGRALLLAHPDNPLVRNCRPLAATSQLGNQLWIATQTGLLQLDAALEATWPTHQPPRTVVAGTEVDGAARNPAQLGELPAGTHRLGFRFRGISLLPRTTGLQYQYRLRNYIDEWSAPTALSEAQFPRLDAGRYVLEVRARLRPQDAWGPVTTVAFGIATPFWRTGWFAALVLLATAAAVWAFVRTREATLRRQKLQLELTVRERTQELRQQKAHIEQINADLVVARDAAEASRRAKAQFLANMSHEIRTPMNAVIGLTHLLQRTPTNPEQTEYLAAIQGSSQNLLTIINDILDSSKIEAGKMTLESTPFGLRGLLQRVARMFEFATASKGLLLRLELAPEVPAAVLGDPVRLNQVLVNLIGNAIKFTTQGTVTVRVTARPEADRWRVRFAVQDTGIGIPADKLDAIFEDFSQANTSTTRQFGGTGLGLSIARNLVELHGGRLWVESVVGVGSTFFFELPYAEADAAALPADAPVELTPFSPPLRVLVAEDNELNQLVARKTLEAWNVQVVVAANGRLAVQTAAATAFDAVLMDVQMPEMDGYEASRQLRRHFPDAAALPIIGLTASALPEDRALALAAGMNETLPKPFDPAVLYATLARFTGRATTPLAAATPPKTPPAAPAEDIASVAPPPASDVEAPDWSLLEELAFGSEAFIAQVIDTFLRDVPPLLEQLRAAVAAHDAAAAASLAHRIKGQLAYFGLPRLHEQLNTLEQQAKQGQLPAAAAAQATAAAAQLQQLFPLLQLRRAAAAG